MGREEFVLQLVISKVWPAEAQTLGVGSALVVTTSTKLGLQQSKHPRRHLHLLHAFTVRCGMVYTKDMSNLILTRRKEGISKGAITKTSIARFSLRK